ncbi:MAG: TonB-dependent receptor [Rubrivivax sp.]|nr:TonB-dependent receptor [Rubrivivax sp.]
MQPSFQWRPALALGLLVACTAAVSQTPPAASASAPARPASAPRGTPPAAAGQKVEIVGGRESDTDLRRQSTAAKIVIGREEIEKFGDATVGEVLRRLPGVTTPGAPGRGGAPRMRGLGSGFTQLLIDGQRLPPGFSLDSLTPEQIDRIEVLRAPTAETGARAIAGTINIITREGFKKRLNDWRVGTGLENGRPSLGSFWTHNDSADNLTYTLSAGLFANERKSGTRSTTEVTDVASGMLLEDRATDSNSLGRSVGLNLGGRLQWRLGEGGDALTLMPGMHLNRNRSHSDFDITEALRRPGITPELADRGSGRNESSFVGPRLMLQYRQRVADWRLEGSGTVRASRWVNDSLRDERRSDGSLLRSQDDHTVSREKGWQLNAKGSRLLGGEGAEHSLVMGVEAESAQLDNTRRTLEDGLPALTEYGDNFEASTMRWAAYAQDEWALSPNWSLHAGLRWEGIATQGDDGLGNRPTNRNSVWTPLVHLLWKPDPKVRDQVRLSLTRSWRAPNTNTLIGRPTITRLYDPALGTNTESSPDSAGNPDLRPELATGIDLAFERYLQGGGLLSANLFHRRITDLMRGVTLLEDVPWSDYPRWVRRTRNIGKASTEGIELEAKFRLDQVLDDSPPVELRANVALYRSRVDGVPGPDNRLDEQSAGTANLGADYRFRGTPLTVGANLNWVPATTTRLAADQTTRTSTKRQWDVFVLWTFNPEVGLRLLANNLVPRDYSTETYNDIDNPLSRLTERTHVVSGGPSFTNWQLRLELKL